MGYAVLIQQGVVDDPGSHQERHRVAGALWGRGCSWGREKDAGKASGMLELLWASKEKHACMPLSTEEVGQALVFPW